MIRKDYVFSGLITDEEGVITKAPSRYAWMEGMPIETIRALVKNEGGELKELETQGKNIENL